MAAALEPHSLPGLALPTLWKEADRLPQSAFGSAILSPGRANREVSRMRLRPADLLQWQVNSQGLQPVSA